MSSAQKPSLWPLNPLTPYDVLGYLAPGGTLLLSLYGFEYWVQHWRAWTGSVHTPVYTVLKYSTLANSDANWARATLFLIALFGVCYVLGHIIGSISAFAIDRVYVAKGHGYPYRMLLKLEIEASEHDLLSRKFYRGLFFWLNVYLLLRLMSLPQVPLLSTTLQKGLGIAANFVGFLLPTLIVLKTFVSAQYGQTDTMLKRWLNGPGKFFSNAVALLIEGANVPYAGITRLVGNYLRTHEPLPEKVRLAFRNAFTKTFGITPEEAGNTTFWFAYLTVRARSDSLTEPAENWLRLYSFARNLGTSLYLAFLYILNWWFFNANEVGHIPISGRIALAAIPLGLFACAFAMLMRFYYLYADYFSKYVLRTFLFSRETMK